MRPSTLLAVPLVILGLAGCGQAAVRPASPVPASTPVFTAAPQPGVTLPPGTTDASLLAGGIWGAFTTSQQASTCSDWRSQPAVIEASVLASYESLNSPTFTASELWTSFERVLQDECGTAPTSAPAPDGWQVYRDVDGDSGVVAYLVSPTSITVRFDDGSEYLYTDASAGASNIETMKRLAAEGDGLNSFILSTVRYSYEQKVSP